MVFLHKGGGKISNIDKLFANGTIDQMQVDVIGGGMTTVRLYKHGKAMGIGNAGSFKAALDIAMREHEPRIPVVNTRPVMPGVTR